MLLFDLQRSCAGVDEGWSLARRSDWLPKKITPSVPFLFDLGAKEARV